LAGFTGSGAIAAAASMLMTPKEYRDTLYAKLLTFVKYILKEKLGDTDSVIKIKHSVSYICEVAEEQLKVMKAEKVHRPSLKTVRTGREVPVPKSLRRENPGKKKTGREILPNLTAILKKRWNRRFLNWRKRWKASSREVLALMKN
jgi:hypothetical protein